MRKRRFSRAISLVIGAFAVAVTLSVARQTAARILGGHGTKTDCFAVFDGIDSTGGATPKVRCMDGDPSCDHDGDCHNGSCTFQFRVCINQKDVSGCTPPAAGLKMIRTIPPKYHSFTGGLTGSKLTQTVCGDQGDVVVKLRGKKKNKPGRQQIRVFAQANGAPPDSDLVNLFCLPRPTTGTCPAPGTTTTTTIPCAPGACVCPGGTPSMLSFTTAVGGSGTCGHVDAEGNPNFFQLNCGGLYFGGAGVAVPLPSKVPDMGSSLTKVSCNCSTLTLQPTSPTEAGGNRCTQGATSKRGGTCTTTADCAGPCTTGADCTPGGTCTAGSCSNANCALLQCTASGCLFGPPLPIPNTSHNGRATSTCVVNSLSGDASGTGDCVVGSTSNLNVPLKSTIFLNGGDLMAMRCSGGANDGANCTGGGGCGTVATPDPCTGGTCVNDTGRCASGGGEVADTPCCSDGDCALSGNCESSRCESGSNANFGCITSADCPGGTCKTLIQPCPICGTTNKCNAGINDGLACTPADSAIDGDYPTSHDCPAPAAGNLGSLPISFVLDSGTITKTAIDNPGTGEQSNVFCGFCKNKTLNTFGQRCNGQASGAACSCKIGTPCPACSGAPCLPIPCTSNGDCTGVTGFTSCGQRTPGAFTNTDTARTIVEQGSPSGPLTTGGPAKPATLVSIFCIPLTFSSLVDGAADLPGPGAVALPGMARALP